MDFPFLSSYEQTLVNYWVEAGQVSHTANGPVAITWGEIDAWVRRFHTEQYVEWVERPRPSRVDGLPDERYKPVVTPLLASQCTLLDWELQMIRKMSQEYVSEYFQTDPSRPCPKEIILDDITEDDKLANANSFEAALKSMFGAEKVPAV